MCVMCVAIPFVLVTIAPRFITAAEVNLFFLLEVILGPIWVWFVTVSYTHLTLPTNREV